MKQHLLPLLFVFIVTSCLTAQQQLGLLGLQHTTDQQTVNPAYIGEAAFEISLFSLTSSIYSNGPVYQDFIDSREKTKVLRYPTDKLNFGQGNLFRTNSTLETFRFRYSQQNWSLALHHASKANGIVDYSGALLAVAIQGNAPYIGQNLTLDTDFSFFSYEEIGLSFSYQWRNIKIGGRANYLMGHAAAITRKSQIALFTDDDIYQLSVATELAVDVAGQEDRTLSQFNFGPIGLDFAQDDAVLIRSPEVLFNLNDALFNFSGNRGLAFDFGLDWALNEKWQLTVSALDLGKINWIASPRNFTANEQFEFDGLSLGQLTFDGDEFISFESIQDSLDIINFQQTENTFSTTLPPQFYLGLGFQLNPKWHLQSTFYYTSFQNNSFTAFSLGANYQVFPILNIGLNYNLMNEASTLFGANITLAAGPVQFFAMTDNLLGVLQATEHRTLNARVGLSFRFGEIQKREAEN